MPAIAIDDNQNLYYEGDGKYGRAIWPAPVIAIATVIEKPEDIDQIPNTSYLAQAYVVFREDSFDPVTRIRRGRLYKWRNTNPEDWLVPDHPTYKEETGFNRMPNGLLTKRLYSYHAWLLNNEMKRRGDVQIALGIQDAYTLWRIVDIERIVTGEDLLTLRARSALGVLPEINYAAIPENGKETLIDTMDRLLSSAYRAGPEDIIESVRAAAQWCLGLYLAEKKADPSLRHVDIGQLIPLLGDARLLQSLAQIFARFHSRAKPNEQERYMTRSIREEDAEYALAAMGLLLREVGWTI